MKRLVSRVCLFETPAPDVKHQNSRSFLMGEAERIRVVGEAVERPLEADAAVMGEHIEQMLGLHTFGDELYGVRYALRHPNNPELVQSYLYRQELTHVQEGARLRQHDSAEFNFVDGNTLSDYGKAMTQIASDGLAAQKRALQDGTGFEFMVKRGEYDEEIAEDNDQRMKELPVGSCWGRITPFAEEESLEDAKDAGFHIQTRRAYLWIYRKVSEDTLEATVVSIDQSDVRAFAGLMHEHGVELPVDITSHDMPGYVIDFDGQVLSEEVRDSLVDELVETYETCAELVEATGTNLTSKEFIEQYGAADIQSLVRLQQEIDHSLRAGEASDFLQASIQAVLNQDYLDDIERQLIRRLQRAEVLLQDEDTAVIKQQVNALRLIVKAHRVGVWKGINEKIKSLESGKAAIAGQLVHPNEYAIGGMISMHEIAQLHQNSSNTQKAAEMHETMPGCPGGAGFLSQNSQADLKESIFSGEKTGQKKWMSCPFCKKENATYDDPCAKKLECRHCKACVKNGKVVFSGSAGAANGPEENRTPIVKAGSSEKSSAERAKTEEVQTAQEYNESQLKANVKVSADMAA